MTATITIPTAPRTNRRTPALHLFQIGETVRLKSVFTTPLPVGTYKVTRQLPPMGNHLQYRIAREGELFERVTTQDNLELVGSETNNAGLSLMARTFGNG